MANGVTKMGLFVAKSAPKPAVIAHRSVKIEVEVWAKIKIISETKSFNSENSPIFTPTSPEHKLKTSTKSATNSSVVNFPVNPRTTSASKMTIAKNIYKTPRMMLTAESKIELFSSMLKTKNAVCDRSAKSPNSHFFITFLHNT